MVCLSLETSQTKTSFWSLHKIWYCYFMLSGFHKHNTLIFSQYFSPSQSWEILGISLVILLHLLRHGSSIPKRKNIRKAFLFFSTTLILKNTYCSSSSILSPCYFPRSDVILLLHTSAGEGNAHGFDRVTTHHRLCLLPLRLLANIHQVNGEHQPIAKINVPWNLWQIPDHKSHASFEPVIECLATLCWIKLVKFRSSNNGMKTT